MALLSEVFLLISSMTIANCLTIFRSSSFLTFINPSIIFQQQSNLTLAYTTNLFLVSANISRALLLFSSSFLSLIISSTSSRLYDSIFSQLSSLRKDVGLQSSFKFVGALMYLALPFRFFNSLRICLEWDDDLDRSVSFFMIFVFFRMRE